ncbi:MAG: DUF4982 domain-containing protein [Lachnospiraceae bacterium]|nr:DUF4982 domain-containing protein [Lachnospiraceae bacterium]
MNRQDFNIGWSYRHLGEGEWKEINLPHDAMLLEARSEKSAGIHNIGWFEGYDYEYKKSINIPDSYKNKHIVFFFEGVYRNAEVYINGSKAGGCLYGYTDFAVDADAFLKYGEENNIRVIARNADQPNSRWYTGSGIYRPVWMYEADKDGYIPLGGLKIRTLSHEPARIEVKVRTSKPGDAELEIRDAEGNTVYNGIVSAKAVVRGTNDSEMAQDGTGINDKSIADAKTDILDEAYEGAITCDIANAHLWNEENPYLYKAILHFGNDCMEETFGVRSLSWNKKDGLTVNGKRVILKGACIHSDNQLLGAVTLPEAEVRRVRLLKSNGYNAIRSAHNPCSRYLLDACDRLGMYMMDEYVDCWYIHKTGHDYAGIMPDQYEADLKAMVDKDYNHPSVIMYSTGNEVAETAQKRGIELTGAMTEYLHSLDDSRPVTCGINIFFNLLSSMGFGVYSDEKAKKEAEKAAKAAAKGKEAKRKAVGSEFYNTLAGLLGDKTMKIGATLHACDVKTRDAFANMDIAGYNYGILRYMKDLKNYPKRLILGSETFCRDAYSFYEIAKANPRIIGDFVWAGMDYLGEAGIGSWEYEDYAPKDGSKAGWIAAGSGRLDLTGKPIGEAYYTRVALEQDIGPYLAVSPVYQRGRHSPSAWKMSDAIRSWAWKNCEGLEARIEVYARAYRVELLLNGKVIGNKIINKDCVVRFKVPYERGTLQAVAYDEKGLEIGRDCLDSAKGEAKLRLIPEEERPSAGKLFYVRLRYTDKSGIWMPMEKHRIKLSVSGGELVGYGNGCPYNKDGYLTDETNTYYGESLAIIRPDKEGTLKIIATENEKEAARSEMTIIA